MEEWRLVKMSESDIVEEFNEYKRLLTFDNDSKIFLDTDTVVVFEHRDAIETHLNTASNHPFSISELKELDDLLKQKVLISKLDYVQRIKQDDQNRDYLKGVFLDLLHFSANESHDKWWWHLLDDIDRSMLV